MKNPIGSERKFVSLVAEQREPARLSHHKVEYVAVDDQIAAAIDTCVDGVFQDLNAAEMRAVVPAQEFVVVAGNVDDPSPLACLPKNLLHDVVVRLRPIPRGAQCPTVDNVADEIDRLGFVTAEKVEKLVGLTAARTKMHIGDEKRAKPSRGVVRHDTTISNAMIM